MGLLFAPGHDQKVLFLQVLLHVLSYMKTFTLCMVTANHVLVRALLKLVMFSWFWVIYFHCVISIAVLESIFSFDLVFRLVKLSSKLFVLPSLHFHLALIYCCSDRLMPAITMYGILQVVSDVSIPTVE